jgi:hypothetical protein
MRLKLKKMPMGTIARRYTRPFMGIFLRDSSIVVQRAMICVIAVEKMRCHVVREIARETVSEILLRSRGWWKSTYDILQDVSDGRAGMIEYDVDGVLTEVFPI